MRLNLKNLADKENLLSQFAPITFDLLHEFLYIYIYLEYIRCKLLIYIIIIYRFYTILYDYIKFKMTSFSSFFFSLKCNLYNISLHTYTYFTMYCIVSLNK